jgi:Uncharacterised nucleotidyltransferase
VCERADEVNRLSSTNGIGSADSGLAVPKDPPKVDPIQTRWIGVESTFPQCAAGTRLAGDYVPTRGASSAEASPWLTRVIDRLVDGAPSLDALRKHRLHLSAARLWQSDGREVPPELLSEVRAAAVNAMLTRFILGKARSAYDGALIVMKGPEVAAHYPVPSDRPFRDLDLLVEDAEAARRALIAAGFAEFGDLAAYAGLQHLPPLIWPGTPLVVEVHRRPSQPYWLAPVSAENIFRTAVPSAMGVPGVLAPEPATHAVLLAAHSWTHDPLGSAGQLLDAAALLASADRRRASAFASALGWEQMWNTTLAVMDDVVGGTHRSLAPKLWARHLLDVRERVVVENHIARLAAPLWSLPAIDVPRGFAWALRYTAAPDSDEGWMTQVRRSRLAIAHAFKPGSEHERSLAWIGPRTRPRRPSSMRVRRRGVRTTTTDAADLGTRLSFVPKGRSGRRGATGA